MKKTNPLWNSKVFLVAASLVLACAARADVVYDNSTTDLHVRYNPGSHEVGDEIVLAPGANYVTNFQFQYWGTFSGTAQARVRFYANDGTNSPAGPLVPNSLLFDSDWFNIDPTTRSTLIFDQTALTAGNAMNLSGAVPDSFTWSVQFQNVTGGGAGVDLYNPPSVGNNYMEFWDNAGLSDWHYSSLVIDGTNGPANFAARVSAVPEPTALWFGLAGGLAALVLRHYARRR